MAGRAHWRPVVFRIGALIAQALAVSHAFDDELVLASLQHIFGAVLVGAAALPPEPTPGGRQLAWCMSAWSLCVPVLGPLGLCLVLLPALAKRRAQAPERVTELDPNGPQHDQLELPVRVSCAELFAGTASEEQRIAALMWLRKCELSRAVPLLRAALSDPYEDVRLLAFALLEKHEKQLRARIERSVCALDALRGKSSGNDTSVLLAQLSHAHWLLAQSGFVSGDALTASLRAAAKYGAAAHNLSERAALAELLARVHLRLHEALKALQYLDVCSRAGAAASVLAPLYAEAAFLTHQYRAVPRLLALANPAGVVRPELSRLQAFWDGRDRP